MSATGGASFATSSKHTAGSELLGRPAPPLDIKQWLNSKPLEMSDLRGSVVLLRWWTQGCPFCVATAPALRKLHEQTHVFQRANPELFD